MAGRVPAVLCAESSEHEAKDEIDYFKGYFCAAKLQKLYSVQLVSHPSFFDPMAALGDQEIAVCQLVSRCHFSGHSASIYRGRIYDAAESRSMPFE